MRLTTGAVFDRSSREIQPFSQLEKGRGDLALGCVTDTAEIVP